ncbi:MAG: ferredoxin--NADP reductase [Bdellovibrionales bacterium]|nr:ferredoxin--NADP reductase [Bdellovibrionales bacterium]
MSIPYYPLKLIKKEFETEKTCSFYFKVPEDHKKLFQYKTAQFLTFRFYIQGKEYIRSYSLASSPFLNENLMTTVGKVEQGVVSNYMLSELKEGDTVESQIPLGEFFHLPKDLKSKDFVLFAGGIGITPLFSILKTTLETGLARKIYLIFSIRSLKDFIYKKNLKELENKFKNQFQIKLIISESHGRLNPDKITKLLDNLEPTKTCFYLCGPKDYMTMISKHLLKLGNHKNSIYTEDFNIIPIRGPKPDEDSIIFNAKQSSEGEPKILKSFLNGEEIEIPLNREKSLLEQLIDQGYNPPFSCTSGSCMSCMARLKEGKIFQLQEGILDEENIKNLEILSCQCYPLSETVHIDYDNL